MEGVEFKVVNEIKADPLITQNANNNVNGLDDSLNSSEKLNDVFADMKDEMKEVLSHFKSLCSTLDDTERKLKSRRLNEITPQPKSEFNETKTGVNGVIGFLQNGNNILGNVAGGNIAGGVITGVNTLGRGLMNSGTQAALSGATSLGKGLLIGGGVALAAGAIGAGVNKLADVYGDALPGIDSIYGNYADADTLRRNNRRGNRDYGLLLRNDILSKNIGTGLGAEDFISLTNSLGRYGINDATKAATIAQSSAQWASYTNGNANTYANFAGLVERYGGNGQNALSQVFNAAKNTGLERSQYSEFLEGIQRVMEEGISKGFIRSAEDISKNIENITLMSGNSDYWQGQAGINRYNSMSNAMASNTSLSTSSNMLLFKAMQNAYQGDSWIDTMTRIEDGQWGDKNFINSYKSSLNNAYNGDKNGIISTIKENFGLNWQGANKVYETLYNGNGDISSTIKGISEDPNYQSDTKKTQELQSQLNTVMTEISSNVYDVKTGSLAVIENATVGLHDHFVKTKTEKDPYKEITGYSYTMNGDEKVVDNIFRMQDLEREMKKNPTKYEKNLYNVVQAAKDKNISESDMSSFMNEIAGSISGGSRYGKDGFIFDTEKLVAAIDKMTKAFDLGIVVEQYESGHYSSKF